MDPGDNSYTVQDIIRKGKGRKYTLRGAQTRDLGINIS